MSLSLAQQYTRLVIIAFAFVGLLVATFIVYYLNLSLSINDDLHRIQSYRPLIIGIGNNQAKISRNIGIYLLDPTTGFHDQTALELLQESVDDARQIHASVPVQDAEFASTVLSLIENLSQLNDHALELFELRIDAGRQFPGMAMAADRMNSPRHTIENILNDLLDSITSRNFQSANSDLLPVLIRVVRLWGNLVAEQSDYMSNRLASVSAGSLTVQLSRVENLIKSFFYNLGRLEEIYAIAGNFEGSEKIQVLIKNANKWRQGLKAVHNLNTSDGWRQDNLEMERNIIPLSDAIAVNLLSLDRLLAQHEALIQSRFKDLSKHLLYSVVALTLLFGVVVILILKSLRLSLFGPLNQLSQALKSNTGTSLPSVPHRAGSEEISTFVDVCQKTLEKLHRRKNEIDDLVAWRQAILDGSEYCVISTDEEGVITTFNQRAEMLLGYKARDMIGKETLPVLFSPVEVREYSEMLAKELGESVEPGFQAIVEKSRRGLSNDREWSLVNKYGNEVPVHLSVVSIQGTDKGSIGFIILALEDSASAVKSTSLRESESRYQKLFTHSSDAVMLMGAGVGIIECNPAALRMFKCSGEQIINNQILNFSPELQADGKNSRNKMLRKMSSALKGKHQFFLWNHTRCDGTPFDAEISLDAVTIANEPHLLAIVRDISA